MSEITLMEAVARMLETVRPLTDTETVDLWHAEDRVLAEDACAVYDYPPFSRSAMDGYALRAEDIAGASPESLVRLTVIDEVCAGHVSDKTVTEGTAIRIMTGAPVPAGADYVLMQEKTRMTGDDREILVLSSGGGRSNISLRGEDYTVGTRLLSAGTRIRAGETAILAGMGADHAKVFRRPKVVLITTGDETVQPGVPLTPGKIYDSNLYTAGSLLRSFGAEIIVHESLPDDPVVVAERLRTLAETADILITTGGVSVGKKDIMHDVLPLIPAERLFWRIAMKPGMPTLCALAQRKPLICLSGNPYGVYAGMQLLVRPVIARLTHREDLVPERKTAVLQQDFSKASRVTRYLRGVLQGGEVCLTSGSQDSGNLRSLGGCDCLVEIPAGTEMLPRGTVVTVIPV